MTGHTSRPATPPPQPVQEVGLPVEQMDITISDDLLDIIEVPD